MKCHRLGALNNRLFFFFYSSGAWKPETKVSDAVVSPEASLPGL